MNNKIKIENKWIEFFNEIGIDYEYKEHAYSIEKGNLKGAFTPSFYLPNVSYTAYKANTKNSKITKGTYFHIGNKDSTSVNLIKDQFFLETAMKEYGEYDFFITTEPPVNFMRDIPDNKKTLNNVIKVERKDRPSGIYFEHKKFDIMTCNHCDSVLFGTTSYEGSECSECKKGQYTSRYENIYKIIENRKNMKDDNAYNKMFVEIDETGFTCYEELEGITGMIGDINEKGGYYQSLVEYDGMEEIDIYKQELKNAHRFLSALQERIGKVK